MNANLKRLGSFMLSAMTAFSLAACSPGGSASSASAAAAEASASAASTSSATEEVFEGTAASTTLFSLTYPDGWAVDETMTSDSSSYCYMELTLTGEESAAAQVNISASKSDVRNYRDRLRGAGIDAYDLVETKNLDMVQVGGVECVEYMAESWYSSSLIYLGRDEASGITVSIDIIGDQEDPGIQTMIRSLKFTLNDSGNVDPPWPWQGEPFSADARHTLNAGNYTVTVDWMKLEDPLIAYDIFSGRVEMTGDTVWVLLDNSLYEYQYSQDGLTYVSEQALGNEGDYEELSSDRNGKLYVSGFMEQMLIMEQGEVTGRIEDVDRALVHPNGTWGISSFFGQPLRKVMIDGETAQIEDWELRSAEETTKGFISENHVCITGTSEDKENVAVWVFDTDGNQQYEFGNTDMNEEGWMGAITDVIETPNGYLVLDGNMRNLLFYGTDGTLLATVDDEELFLTAYPWISSACLMPDGSILIALTEERADESAYELLIYRLSGF